ncbi:MAG TPA: polyphenol oxidase family protein, partial [Streptosporangiaceae bacterium]
VPGTDVLVTADPGTVLAVLAADCVPIVLYDPVAQVLACAHSGWRGTVARTAAAAVRAMQSLGSRPADVIAAVGPAIPAARYQVGAQVAEAAAETFGDQAAAVLALAGPDQWRFDLWAANRLVLRDAGVQDTNIHVTGVPTGDRFFSHRAQQPCGRFAAIARLDRPDRKLHHQEEGR